VYTTEQFPRVVGTLVGDDKNAQRDAIATVYSISFGTPRTAENNNKENRINNKQIINKHTIKYINCNVHFAAEQRKLVELPEELWSKAIHLLRVDPSNVTTAQPKEILCPLLIALCNLTIGAFSAIARTNSRPRACGVCVCGMCVCVCY
jgi:hypothetical protein